MFKEQNKSLLPYAGAEERIRIFVLEQIDTHTYEPNDVYVWMGRYSTSTPVTPRRGL